MIRGAIVLKEMNELYKAVENDDLIYIDNGMFTKEVLHQLYEEGCFKPSPYNDNDPYNDYKFLCEMLDNKDRTPRQGKKCTTLILTYVRNHIREKLGQDRLEYDPVKKDKFKTYGYKHPVDITGQRFEHLVAIKPMKGYKHRPNTYWLFRCDCGNEKIINRYLVHKGQKTCGCKMKGIETATDSK